MIDFRNVYTFFSVWKEAGSAERFLGKSPSIYPPEEGKLALLHNRKNAVKTFPIAMKLLFHLKHN